jgi:hypothetical protein
MIGQRIISQCAAPYFLGMKIAPSTYWINSFGVAILACVVVHDSSSHKRHGAGLMSLSLYPAHNVRPAYGRTLERKKSDSKTPLACTTFFKPEQTVLKYS